MKASLVQSHSPSSQVERYLPSETLARAAIQRGSTSNKKNSDADKEVQFFRKQVAPKKLQEGSAF